MFRFAFPRARNEADAYMSRIDEPPHSNARRPTRVTPGCMETDMNIFARLFAPRRQGNLTTALERQRLGRTMPGQTAALAAARLGYLVN